MKQSAFGGVAPWQNSVHVNKGMVQKLFQRVKVRKSSGPDGIGGRLFKNCAEQLADKFYYIFNWSPQLHRAPHRTSKIP